MDAISGISLQAFFLHKVLAGIDVALAPPAIVVRTDDLDRLQERLPLLQYVAAGTQDQPPQPTSETVLFRFKG